MVAASPRISVLIPCRNARVTLDEAVDSIQQQSRMRVLHHPHRGLIESLNAGLAESRAPLIARMDADDRSQPDRLEAQAALLAEQPDLAAVGCLVEAFPAQEV